MFQEVIQGTGIESQDHLHGKSTDLLFVMHLQELTVWVIPYKSSGNRGSSESKRLIDHGEFHSKLTFRVMFAIHRQTLQLT